MGLEIERKYLVVGEFKDYAHHCSRMVQGYLATGNRTVRVRISDDGAWLTIKGPSSNGGLTRVEWEKEITKDEAYDLLQLSVGAVIEKDRYYIYTGTHTIEVDEFYGPNRGLVLAEIELQYEHEQVDLPPWIGREVTGEKRFYNSHLRTHPYCEWLDEERE
jgi:CYTH domain-containing protein